YKRRDIAIAELVANSWDAGATRVDIYVPQESEYRPETSEIVILDNGIGMTDDEVENEYLVVGRNRRLEDSTRISRRPVMGKKGIGKLAGFGLASEMSVLTWKGNVSTQLTLDVKMLQTDPGSTKLLEIPGVVEPRPADAHSLNGTKILLRNLKHKSPPDITALHEALSRRFSRRVHGEMEMYVNDELINEPSLDIDQRFPSEGLNEATLPNGVKVRYYYAFTKSNIRSKELQGFTIYVLGKTAQAPPFFFQVEATASGLHWTRYMTGEIEADYLDEGSDNESDIISTDRQEIDWADERSQELKKWGETLTRKALREWAVLKGDRMEAHIMQFPEINERIQVLDSTSQKQVSRFLKVLGQAEPNSERALELADALVSAFEYRHFHDVIDQLENVSDDPEQLSTLLIYLSTWKVLESRAILEIIKGRLGVIEKFHSMIVNDVPETASSKSLDNMHDLLAGYPWILNPEWQVLAEEKRISTQLKEWNAKDIEADDEKLRYDFLALNDDRRLVIIEIKRAGRPVELDELQRLEKYKERLSKASGKELYMVMICGGVFNISNSYRKVWEDRRDGEIRLWSDVYGKTSAYYKHYRAVLEGDIHNTDFARKEQEIAQTRKILQPGTAHRGPSARKEGLGPQDRNDKD
ncbi:ATP-binding protein, partial [Candidatus Bathyarchaeota archaeon]|nr:ATP-binding protein [Candidatus Bathyarchaeota archaeon]